ncbi:hypothetical protein Hdeb2414_s0023g00638961 [Helianthus debilis subsp. tardiflorus]
MGAPLEDDRHLAQPYDRMRQEAKAQVRLLLVVVMKSDPLYAFNFWWL